MAHRCDTLIEDIIAWRPFDSPSASGSGAAPANGGKAIAGSLGHSLITQEKFPVRAK
jgi:hypothetical protein